MPVDGSTDPFFAFGTDDLAKLDAIREALLDPSPRRIGRLDQWGLADDYEVYAEIGQYSETTITLADGTQLDASLSVPRGLAPGQTCPAVVLPAPLISIGHRAYLGMLSRWTQGGYVVLAYSQRGLAKSTGEIHVAGPQDVADAAEVVDWLLTQNQVDAERIGFFGASYGAGTSLLAAASDPRIKVVAGTSAWADLFTSLYENGTRHLAAFEALVTLFGEDRCSPEFREVIQKIRANTIDDQVREFARVRSPRNNLAKYNDAATAILLTTSWHETIFSVPAVIDFHNNLTGPKTLLIQVGDHGNAELPGLAGLPAKPTDMAYRWMDYHLGGTAGNGAPPRFDIRSEYMFNPLSDLRHASWDEYAQPKKRFHLADAASGQRDGQLVEDQPQAGWTRSVKATGKGTNIVVAPKLVQTGLAERWGLPNTYRTAETDRGLAAVFATAPVAQASRVRGDLELRVTVKAQQAGATIVAYLLDLNPATGSANIITHAPYTFTDQPAGQATTVTFPLQPADYVVARGRQLQLVIDTQDPFFSYENVTTPVFTLDITSPKGSESYLDIPLQPID
ncbi:CocE/NonD family hydrolase [Kitasatospora viridis]|uniref:Putative CocE/NonD family hydrolase n=1 Tax=Kitasatospora viridis TaxID=281105 RepID=A0A561TS83_9ACTN|nr:CocE/NonD family hydrolase [Kitasatospora viridis]TWF89971.1 putative CocE/NonD family hydrolase [Kitasatospora viridis]